jgi:hypothetical protein
MANGLYPDSTDGHKTVKNSRAICFGYRYTFGGR